MSSDESDAGTPRANQTDASSKLDSVSGTAGASGDNRGSQQAAGAGGTADSTATNTAPQSDGTAGTAASTVPMSSASAATGGASASTVAPACGNNKVETGETCDGDCPVEADCTAPDPCLTPQLMGDASLCSAECSTSPISQCLADDKCCPEGCTSTDDPDCSPSCGNNAIEDGETCDPQSACPTSCDDGDPCTTDMQTGSAAQCNVNCTHEPVVAPKNGDGCCPSNGNANNDGDCTAKCGNGVVEDGETCDPPGSCETSCDDGDPCTVDTSMGDASSCSFECGPKMPVPARGSSDRCCPPNATLMDDPDCPVPSGWTVVERGTCSAGALRLFSGASVACNSSACSCSAAPKNNCRGGIAGVQASGGGPVWVTATSCGASIGSATNVNVELAGIMSMPDSGGCTASGRGEGEVAFDGEQTFCPVRSPRTSSCLTRAGEVSCPDGYRSRTVLYKSYRGGGCRCSGCGVATSGSCNQWRYSRTGCPSSGTSASANQGLAAVDLTTLRVWIEETPAKCGEASADALDDVQVTEPQTVCCP